MKLGIYICIKTVDSYLFSNNEWFNCFDINDKDITIGEMVELIHVDEGHPDYGNAYRILKINNKRYFISHVYFDNNFLHLAEYREQQINSIIND